MQNYLKFIFFCTPPSQVKSRVTPLGNIKAAHSVNNRGLPGGGGSWVCIWRPQQLYGPRGMSVRARALRCKQLFRSELRVLASLLLCACALDSPFRSRKPAFTTWRGSALQRRGPSPGGVSLLGFSGPAAPCHKHENNTVTFGPLGLNSIARSLLPFGLLH